MQIMNKYYRASASMVYIMTNNHVINQIIAFYRNLNGMLTFVGSYPTNGRGTGVRSLHGNRKRWRRPFSVTRRS
jgi:6-phosphogluconolactonase